MGRGEVAAVAAAAAGALLLVFRSGGRGAAPTQHKSAERLHRLSQNGGAGERRVREHAPHATPTGNAAGRVRQETAKLSILGTIFAVSALLCGLCACIASYVPIPGVSVSDLVDDRTRIYVFTLGLATVAATLHLLFDEGKRKRRSRRAAHAEAVQPITEETFEEPHATPEELRTLGAKISGEWSKDVKNSSSMDPALDLIQSNWFLRQAVKLIKGMTVNLDQEMFRFSVYSAIKVFAVRESYAITGLEGTFPRRDLRRGSATGRATFYRNRVLLVMHWTDPLAGSEVMARGPTLLREFTPSEDGTLLRVHCVVNLTAGASATYTHIYRRKTAMRALPQ